MKKLIDQFIIKQERVQSTPYTDTVGKMIGLIIEHEGFKSKPYTDTVGKITIGVGRNLTDNGLSKEEIVRVTRG